MTLQLRDVRRRFVGPDGTAVQVVHVDSFELGRGEHVGLVGRSGSGKTTLLYLIAGILRADSGAITYTLEGQGPVDLAGLSEAQRDIFRGKHLGYIFQTHQLLPAFTALENVLLGMSFTGRHEDRKWAEHLLTEVGLADRMGYRPGKLSVGQQQRVAVARALANRPAIVLADEPTGALDPDHAQGVLDLIRKLCNEVQATLLLVSHDMQIVRQLQRVVKFDEINQRNHEDTVTRGDTKKDVGGGGLR